MVQNRFIPAGVVIALLVLGSAALVTPALGGTPGEIASWGYNNWGQVSQTPAGTGYTDVAAGYYHSLALRADGSIASWGFDGYGQVSQTPAGTGYTAIAGGEAHSLALRADGSIASWGWDGYGQVSQTPAGTGFTAVAAGGFHNLALRADGSIVSWGRDYERQVSQTPTGTGFTAIAAGRGHSLALRADGSIASWGSNSDGLVSQTPAGTGFTDIAAGDYHSLALRADGSIVSWGRDNYGQVSQTPPGTGLTAVAAGAYHSLALGEDVTPPTVVSTDPADGATGVTTDQTISIAFSESVVIGESTVTSYITVRDGATPVPYASWQQLAPGQYEIGGGGGPDDWLSPGRTYTVTVQGVPDWAGNVMTEPYEWSFTTVNEPPVASFTATPTYLSVAFTDTSTGTGPLTCAWDFGDGGSSTDPSPTHEYAAAGTYTVTLTVTGPGGTDDVTQEVTVSAPPVAPVAAFTATPTYLSVAFTDTSTGTAPLTYAWDFGDSGSSTDQSPTHVYATAGTYTVTLTVTGPGGTDDATQEVTVAAQPVAPVAAFTADPTSGPAPLTVAFDAAESSDPDGTIESYDWTFGDGSSGSGETVSHTYTAPGTYTVTLTVTDDDGATAEDTLTVTVENAAPVITGVTVPADPVAVKTSVSATATFTDARTEDTHTATWAWGDGATSAGTVAGGSVSGTHAYATAGVYEVSVTVTDEYGGTDTEPAQTFVVVYDPSGGFVTGGGWIQSPAGAYVADPALAGKATFGFVSKYQKGATVPTGQTQFEFHAADFRFHSTSYDWLVIAGAKAQFKGTGTVNGAGDYGFMLTATDGQVTGGGGTDKFRLKVWDRATEATVYDNQLGAADGADPTTVLGGGSIVVHKK